jgi:ABC-type transport system involved in multi-copper enzyme maturation permease subunit
MLLPVVTLPIAQREMLVLARSAALYRTRITNSIALLFLGAGFATLYHYTGLQVLGQLIPTLTFIILMICLFAGVHLTADSISREKRDGTLGLLFLTNLTPFQIVIGKLIAHGLMGFYAVLIVVPLLSLIMIVGGMQLFDVAMIGLTAFNVLFFSCAVGLWASSRNSDRKKAGAAGTWTVIFFWWGIPLLVQGLLYIHAPDLIINAVSAFSVNGTFTSTMGGRITLMHTPWVNFLCTHFLAWTFVALAVYYLRHRWQDAPARTRFTFREWWKNKSLGTGQIRRQLREQLLDRNPFLWLASRDRWRTTGAWMTTIGFLIFMVIQVYLAGWDLSPVVFFTAILCIVHKAVCAGVAAHQLSLEQEQGTLEMILSTPIKTETIFKGQILAVARQFRGPALICLILHILSLGIFLYIQPVGRGAPLVAAAIIVNLLFYLLDLYIMIWAGMFGAVTVKEAKNATGAAMVRIILMPAVIFGLIVSSVSFLNWYFQLGIDVHPALIVLFYFLIWITNSLSWLTYFRRRMPTLLREFALKRYTPEQKKGILAFLSSLFRKSPASPPLLQQIN